jgi:hypothetical protein
MNLDDEAFSSRSDTGTRHRGYKLTPSGGVTGIDNHREMGQFMEEGNTREVKDVACVRIIAADAAFTEDDVGVA